MAAGDIVVKGPYAPNDTTGIAAVTSGLKGAVVVADSIVPYYDQEGRVYFVIVKAA